VTARQLRARLDVFIAENNDGEILIEGLERGYKIDRVDEFEYTGGGRGLSLGTSESLITVPQVAESTSAADSPRDPKEGQKVQD